MPIPASRTPSLLPTRVSRISWVILLRLLIVSALLGSTILMGRGGISPTDESLSFLFGFIVTTYALSIVYTLWFKWGRGLYWLAMVQLSLDAVLFSGLVHATGGIFSGFTFLLHLWVIVAAVASGKGASYVQASVSTVLMLIVAWIPPGTIFLPDLAGQLLFKNGVSGILYSLSVNVAGLYLVALLVNILVTRIDQTSRGLLRERAEKKELEIELENTRHLAALGRLAATLAHEIRNPLSAVSGAFQMLLGSFPEGDDNTKLADIVDRELQRMGRLVEDILAYTRPSALSPGEVDYGVLCTEVMRLFEAGNRNIQISVRSVCDGPVMVVADANQIRQVLWNILINASQSMFGEGTVALTVGRMADDYGFVRITDTGQGIREEDRERVFEPFYSTKEQGMGLGLALSRKIAEAHGGRVILEESSASGTTFLIYLPLARPGSSINA